MKPRISLRWSLGISALTALAMVSGSSLGVFAAQKPASVRSGGTITFINAPNTPFVANFNPWSPNNTTTAMTQIFEPLLYFNAYTGKIEPKLAVSYHYLSGHKGIVFNLRHGVKWSNGRAFTAKDVAFTLDMLIKNPAIDLNDLSSMIRSVTANSTYQVTVTLKTPNVTDLYYIAGATPIVPASQWQAVKNPATFTDSSPVTTGPFKVGSVNRNQLVLVKNHYYWDAPLPYVNKIVYPTYLSNNTAALAMDKGQFTLAMQFIPDIRQVLLSKNPSIYHYWFPPVGENILYLNDAKYPFSLLPFRQALNHALNRTKLSKIGEYGYETPSNATGLPPTPLNRQYINSSIVKRYAPVYSPKKARAILQQAGFHWKGGRLIDPKGQAVSMTIYATNGATDWVSDASIMANEFRAIGINARVATPSYSTLAADLASGSYQAAVMRSFIGGPGPYYEYYPLLDSAFTAPVGKTAISNYERWSNPTTNRLLAEYVKTFSQVKRQQILNQLETIMAKDLPVIPFLDFPAWEQYNTSKFGGFPTAKNPYAELTRGFDSEYVLAQIHQK